MIEIKEGIVWSWGLVTVLCFLIIIMNSLHVVDLNNEIEELNQTHNDYVENYHKGIETSADLLREVDALTLANEQGICRNKEVNTEFCAANCEGFEIGECSVSFDVNVDDCSQSYRYEKTVVDLTRNTVGFEVPEVMVAIDDVCTTDECDYSDENPNQWIMEE